MIKITPCVHSLQMQLDAANKRIAELENLINSQVFPSIGDGFSCEYINGYEKALSDLDKALKERGE